MRPATPPPRDFQRGIPFHRVLTTSTRTGGRAGVNHTRVLTTSTPTDWRAAPPADPARPYGKLAPASWVVAASAYVKDAAALEELRRRGGRSRADEGGEGFDGGEGGGRANRRAAAAAAAKAKAANLAAAAPHTR